MARGAAVRLARPALRRRGPERPAGRGGHLSGERLDVDARFLLANERTLLAWVRTALTLVAAGAALLQLADGTPSAVAAALLLAAGALSAVAGAVRWRRADRALRAGRLPATGSAPAVLAAAVALLAVGLLVVLAGRALLG